MPFCSIHRFHLEKFQVRGRGWIIDKNFRGNILFFVTGPCPEGDMRKSTTPHLERIHFYSRVGIKGSPRPPGTGRVGLRFYESKGGTFRARRPVVDGYL
jgi:hypothetical protein